MTEENAKLLAIVQDGAVPAGYTKVWHLMPEEWKDVPLSYIFTKKNQKNKGNSVKTVFTNSAVNGIIPQSEYFEKDIANSENTEGYFVVDPLDYVYNPRISENAPYGPFKRNDTGITGIVSPLYTVLTLRKEFCESEFLHYYLESAQWHKYAYSIANYGARFDRMNITDDELMRLPIAWPSLAEQERIAEILMQCDKVIELKQKRIGEEKKKKKWLMHYFFGNKSVAGWSAARYSDVCDLLNGRAYKQEELLASGAYPVLRVGNLFTKGDWYYSDLELSEDKYIDNGDLIYAWSASFGPRIWTGGKVIYHYHIWKVVPKNSIDKDYLYQYFLYDVELLAKEQQGGIMSHIAKEMMEKRECRFPEFDKQKEIAQTLSQLDEHIRLLEKECDAWMLKKKALMQLLLTGIVRAKV